MTRKLLLMICGALMLCAVPGTAAAQQERGVILRMETLWVNGAVRVALLRGTEEVDWKKAPPDEQYRLLVFMSNHLQARMIAYVSSARSSPAFATCGGGGGLKLDRLQLEKLRVDDLVRDIARASPDPETNLFLYGQILARLDAVEGPCFREWLAAAGAGEPVPAWKRKKAPSGNIFSRVLRKIF